MKVKLFLDGGEAAFSHQLINFVHGLANPADFTVFLVRDSQVDSAVLQAYNVAVYPYSGDSCQAMMDKLAAFLAERNLSLLEIHCGLGSCRELLPLLETLNAHLPVVHLNIYDDDYADLAGRSEMATLPSGELAAALKSYGSALRATLKGEKTMVTRDGWSLLLNYAWPDAVQVTYYPSGYALDNFSPLERYGLSCCELAPLDEKQSVLYLRIFALPAGLYFTLQELMQHPDCLTVVGGEPLFNSTREVHGKRWLAQLAGLTRPQDAPVIYGGKNVSEHQKITTVLGRNVLFLPDNFPLAALKLLGLAPKIAAGVLSPVLLKLEAREVVLAASHEEELGECAAARVAVKCGMLAREKVVFLGEVAAFADSRPPQRIFYSTASMGDVVYALGCLTALRENMTERFVFAANGLYADLINASPAVDDFWDIHALTAEQNVEILAARKRGKLHTLSSWGHFLAPQHMTDAFLQDFPGSFSEWQKQPSVAVPAAAQSKADAFIERHRLKEEKVVLLHPNIGAPNRTWSLEQWHRLAHEFLSSGWKVVLIGSDTNKHRDKKMMAFELPGVIDAINQFSVLETIALMRRCQLLVACDSGPVALAGMTSIAICALYSLIPSAWRLPVRNGEPGWNALGVDVGCHFGQCGGLIQNAEFIRQMPGGDSFKLDSAEFAKWCPNNQQYSCLKAYSAPEFWLAITRFLTGERFVLNR